MTVYLINPSDVSFGIGVITPRWLYVLAAATPSEHGDPVLVDETLEAIDPAAIRAGDIVGIGIHTGNARRGYAIGVAARARGAYVVFGGIHATLYPSEAHDRGGAHAVVTATAIMSGRLCSAIARPAPRVPSTTAAGSTAAPSCPAGGPWFRAAGTCGPRYRRSAAVPSIAPSARCGGRMANVPASAVSTR
jgi:hypothetical protein